QLTVELSIFAAYLYEYNNIIMKKLTFLLVCFLLFAGEAGAQSVDNRDSLLNFFEKTKNDLFREVEELTPEQLKFKPSAEKWSISQCLEHIVLTEQMLFAMAKDSLAGPANPARRNEVKITSDQLIAGILDRSFQAKAPEGLQPAGKYSQAGAASWVSRPGKAVLRSEEHTSE